MRYVTIVARVLLGLLFTATGLNGVLISVFGMQGFMPAPKEMPPGAAEFFQAMTHARYMLPLIGWTQLVAGLMILTGVWTALGLTLLAPVVVNILLFHLFVNPEGLGLAWAVVTVELFLVIAYGPAFRGVLNPCAKSRWSPAKTESVSTAPQPTRS